MERRVLSTWLAIAICSIGVVATVRVSAVSVRGGTVRGAVRLASSHRPLAAAAVSLQETSGRVPTRSTVTDEQGLFRLEDVPPGRFEITASKPGYLDAHCGGKRPGDLGTPVVVLSGSTEFDCGFEIWSGAVLTGVVVSADGKPLVNATATAGRLLVIDGERVAVSVSGGQAKTDDRGIYRIIGLPPGDYLVSVGVPPGAGVQAENQVPTFYPGTSRIEDARPVSVIAEEIKAGLDFHVAFVPYARIAGTITGSGMNSANVGISLSSRSPNRQGVARRVTLKRDGTFDIENVPPGSYLLIAQSPSSSDGNVLSAPVLWASASVQVNGADLSGVALVLEATEPINGRLLVGGLPPRVPVTFDLKVMSRTSGALMFRDLHADSSGQFQVPTVPPGPYRMTAARPMRDGQLANWTIDSVDVGGRDAIDLDVEMTAVTGSRPVTVDFELTASEVRGTVTDELGRPADDRYLVVFPTDRALWRSERRIRVARPATDGSFEIMGLPNGDYFIGTTPVAGPRSSIDQGVLEVLSRASVTRLSLVAGETRSQRLTIMVR